MQLVIHSPYITPRLLKGEWWGVKMLNNTLHPIVKVLEPVHLVNSNGGQQMATAGEYVYCDPLCVILEKESSRIMYTPREHYVSLDEKSQAWLKAHPEWPPEGICEERRYFKTHIEFKQAMEMSEIMRPYLPGWTTWERCLLYQLAMQEKSP